jgi:hypothetical protein
VIFFIDPPLTHANRHPHFALVLCRRNHLIPQFISRLIAHLQTMASEHPLTVNEKSGYGRQWW